MAHSYWKEYIPKLVLRLLFLALTGFQFELCAQTPQIDSLLQVITIADQVGDKKGLTNANLEIGHLYITQGSYKEALKHYDIALKAANEANDTILHNTINRNIGYAHLKLDEYDIAIKILEESIVFDQKAGNRQGLTDAYITIAQAYENKTDYEPAYRYFQEALKISTELGDSLNMAHAYYGIGDYNRYYKINYHEALNYHNKALQIFLDINYSGGIAATYIELGTSFAEQGNYTEALNNLLLALKVLEENNNRSGMAAIYCNIALVYQAQNDLKSALENQLLSLKLHEEIGARIGWNSANINYLNIGVLYTQLGEYDKALTFAQTSLKLSQEFGNPGLIIDSQQNIGFIYNAKNEYNEAISYYEEALRISREIVDSSEIANCYYFLGKSNIGLKNYELAKSYLEDAMASFKMLGSRNDIRDTYLALAELDSLSGDQHLALTHYKQYVAYQDSLNEAIHNQSEAIYNQSVAELLVKFETEKKETEILRLENEKEIGALNLQVKNESLARMQIQSDKLNAQNLFQMERIDLLDKEKQLQQLELDKDQCDITAQQAEAQKKEDQLKLLNQQGKIKDLDLKRKTLIQNYMMSGFFLFSLLGTYMYAHYRTRQKLKLQILRNKIANDLHDDVGSTLSSIAIFSEMAQQQSKETIPMLNTIHESSRKMLDAMADIVWTINPENDQFEKIIMRMRNFAYELLGAKKIDFQFTADEEAAHIKLPMEVRKNLYLIFKEATNNLVKYSEASKAQYSITKVRNEITMLIRDNGKGFDIHSTVLGNGLKSMRKRAEEMGGKLILNSQLGQGTSIMLKIEV